jgi:hypothetical protein
LGLDHPWTLPIRNSLANAFMAAGRLSEVIALFEATNQRMEVNPGPDHPHTRERRSNPALANRSTGRLTAARVGSTTPTRVRGSRG